MKCRERDADEIQINLSVGVLVKHLIAFALQRIQSQRKNLEEVPHLACSSLFLTRNVYEPEFQFSNKFSKDKYSLLFGTDFLRGYFKTLSKNVSITALQDFEEKK